jgi:hypothetical protein
MTDTALPRPASPPQQPPIPTVTRTKIACATPGDLPHGVELGQVYARQNPSPQILHPQVQAPAAWCEHVDHGCAYIRDVSQPFMCSPCPNVHCLGCGSSVVAICQWLGSASDVQAKTR